MQLFDSENFLYKNNKLYAENISVNEIIKSTGTPVYIYSKKHFVNQYLKFTKAFKDIEHIVYYAVKANYNINVINIFSKLGCGLDVNSEGELIRALKAGAKPGKIILTGVGKTEREIELGIKNNLQLIKAESIEEIYLINDIAKSLNSIAPLAIRVNPDVDPKTHPYISTGLKENKFGIDSKQALEAYQIAASLSNLKLSGIDMHIGSQITEVEPYVEAISKLADIYNTLKKQGIELNHFDIGGGIGVVYKDEKVFDPSQLAKAIIPIIKPLKAKLSFELGRYLTANGGILVTEVLYTKKNQNKNFVVVDAAMTDLLRPSIYKAYHHIQPVLLSDRKDIIADVVGPVCESGDFLAKGRQLTECSRGEKLAIMSAGAYAMVMASNYNGRRRPPEVIVDGNKFHTVRSRETFDHLLYDEKIVEDLT